jgi:hypothetical protein
LDALESASHTHSNKAILDATTASFTTADETKLDGIEALADVTDSANVGSSIDGSTAKTTPIDADTIPLIDSAASNVLKKLSWLNIKATLKTYFDTLYQAAGTYLTSANIVQTITNGVTTNAPSEDAVFDALAGKQGLDSDLTDLASKWTAASASGAASLQFAEDTDNGTNKVTIQAPSTLAADYTLTLPSDDGAANQVLKTDGSGNLSWADQSGGGGNTQIYLDQSPDNGTYALLSGTINGSNTLFTVSQGVYISGTLVVARNGQVLTQGGSNDWVETTPASGTFTFNTAPNTGDVLTAWYNKTVVVGANFTSGTAAPSGGVDGDIYLQYT